MNLATSNISEECRKLLQNSPFGVCLLGPDFKIMDANQLWLDELSLNRDEILGQRLSGILPQIKKNLPELLTEVLTTDKAFHTQEIPLKIEKDGISYLGSYNFIYHPVYGADDELEYFTCIAIENTNVSDLKDQLAKSDERLRLATESSKISTWDLDLKTDELFHSDTLAEIFGYDAKKKLPNSVFRSHIILEDQKMLENALENSYITGEHNFEGRILDAGKQLKWINISGKVFFDENDKPSRMLGITQDISDRKSFQQEIKNRDTQFRFLADAMPQFIWVGDKTGKLHYFNQSVFDFSGKKLSDFTTGQGWLQIVHPDDREKNIAEWTKSVKNKTIFSLEHRFQNKNGDYRWMLSRALPAFDENGEVKHWIGTSTDINDIKKQEYQKNDFIKMANHELKTPITTIKGYVQLLRKTRGNSDDQFLNNSLFTIENQVNKLNNLVGDLLDISRMENGHLPLVKKHFSLVKLVTETIEDIKASEHTHEISFVLNHKDDVEVKGDKERITQVLNNLLTNAIKYSPSSKEVIVELCVENERVIVSVEDFGIGMDEEELNKIFERFYRVSGEDEETFPGFGIGLFIVKDILTRHGGEIWVESKKESGSKFYFSLPLNKN